MNAFEDARTATEEMFENDEQLASEESITEEPVEEPTEEPVEPSVGETLDNAVNTAEVAAQVAQEKDAELQQVLQELEDLKAQNQTMQGTIEELSKKNEENLIEDAFEMPTLDINGLAFADEATVAQSQAEYAQKMAEFVRSGVMKELEPFVKQAKEGQYQQEKADLLSALAQLPEFKDIDNMIPQLDHIISVNKWLQSEDMPIDEKYINAYAMARGVNAINTPPVEEKKLTDDELMKLYDENPTFQELIEKKRIDALKNSQQVPPFSASSGAVNAALNIKEKPKSWDDASERTRKMFCLE